MAAPLCLRGPPELYLNQPSSLITTHEEENPPPGKNLSSRHLNPCLEFFFLATKNKREKPPKNPPMYGFRYSPWSQMEWDHSYLKDPEEKAWNYDPLTTLRLIFCLRMVGRPNEEAFYKSLLWLHKNHPLSLALNLKVFGDLGWFKDLLVILQRVLKGSIDEAEIKEEEKRERKKSEKLELKWQERYARRNWSYSDESKEEEEIEAIKDVKVAQAKRAVDAYQNDPEYRYLHDSVSQVFVELLRSDLGFLQSGEIEKISCASKFCPSIDSSFDKATLICENIAKRMFPRHECEEYRGVEEAHYAYRVRDRLRKQVLTPLRKALKSSSSAKQNNKSSLSTLFKNHKALIALEIYRKINGCGDAVGSPETKFQGYRNIIGCSEGVGSPETKFQFKNYFKIVYMLLPKATIFDTCLGDGKLPHQIVASLVKKQDCKDEIAEVQWWRLIEDLSNKGKLKNCIAVCDVPESRRGTMKEIVCISMGLLVSELSEKPWQGSLFSFSDFPRLQKIEGDNLHSKCEFMRNMDSAEKVDFLKIYNRVLQIAITEKLSNAKMPKMIFVFTYKEFEEASKNNWVQDYKEAWANYRKRGYATVPQLVFWNLKDPIAEPEAFGSPVKNHNGGMILTGFSNTLLSLFLKGEWYSKTYAAQIHAVYGIDVLSLVKLAPKVEDVMKWAISTEELKNVLVLD